jgi:hypothetical protein
VIREKSPSPAAETATSPPGGRGEDEFQNYRRGVVSLKEIMPSFDASIDYLELLGLDLSDGTRFGAEQLKQAIREKRKEWTAQAVNPLYQQPVVYT